MVGSQRNIVQGGPADQAVAKVAHQSKAVRHNHQSGGKNGVNHKQDGSYKQECIFQGFGDASDNGSQRGGNQKTGNDLFLFRFGGTI